MGRYRRTKYFVDAIAGQQRTQHRRRNPLDDIPGYDEEHVRQTIAAELNRGNKDKALVAVETCDRLFGNNAIFPPGPQDDEVAQQLWALVVDAVDDVFKQRRSSHVPWTPSSNVVIWEIRHLRDPGYPWERPSLDVYNAAVPSTFIEATDDFDEIVRDYVANALLLSDMNVELANGSSSTSKRLRRDARKLINGVRWHDLYRTAQIDPTQILDWRAVHADNLNRLAQGLAPQRTVDKDGSQIVAANDVMLLWLPAIDRRVLHDKIPTLTPMKWSDGSSTQEPPPIIRNFGMDMNGVTF